MQVALLPLVLFSSLAIASSSDAQLLAPSAFASIEDNSPLDGMGDLFNSTIFNGITSKGASLEERAVREFDIAHLVGATVLSAQITGTVSANNSLDTGVRSFDFLLYPANSVAELSDYQVPGVIVGSGSYAPPTDVSFDFSFDITADVQSILDGGATSVGLRVVVTSLTSATNALSAVRLSLDSTGGSPLPYFTKQSGKVQIGSPRIADLDRDGVDEIILATASGFDGSTAVLEVWRTDGSDQPGFPINLVQGSGASPAVVDLDQNGVLEIIVSGSTLLEAYDHLGIPIPGWNISVSARDIAVGDIDGDGLPEIVVNPTSGPALSYESDGSFKTVYGGSGFAWKSAPALADLDGDGFPEIIGRGDQNFAAWNGDGTMLAGFPVAVPGDSTARPLVGDLDLDGSLEILITSEQLGSPGTGLDRLYLVDSSGIIRPGWPQSVPIQLNDQPSITDLDGDGDLELVVLGEGATLTALHHTGAPVGGFPVVLQSEFPSFGRSALTSADIDGDELAELVVQLGNAIFAIDGSGATLPGYPRYLPADAVISTSSPAPAIADIDKDGLLEIIATASSDITRVFQIPLPFSSDLAPWPQDDGNRMGTSQYLPPALSASRHDLPVSGGTTIDFDLTLGASNAGRPYLIAVGGSGTAPGVPLPRGPGLIPINIDAFTLLALSSAAAANFPQFVGTLDGAGNSSAALITVGALPLSLIGTRLNFAVVLGAPFDLATVPIGIVIIP